MKRVAILTALLGIILPMLVLTNSSAQTAAPSQCDLSAVIKEAAGLTSTGDSAQDMTALLKLRDEISDANVTCNGLTFTGKNTTVLDPFTLPKGTYRLKFVSGPAITAELKPIGGKYCALGVLTPDQPMDAVEVEADCRITIDINTFSDHTTPWTITFEPLQ